MRLWSIRVKIYHRLFPRDGEHCRSALDGTGHERHVCGLRYRVREDFQWQGQTNYSTRLAQGETYSLRAINPTTLRWIPHQKIGRILTAGRIVQDTDNSLVPEIWIDAG